MVVQWSLEKSLGSHMGTNDAVMEVHRLISDEREITTLEDALQKWEELTGLNRSTMSSHEKECITSYISAL